MATSLPSPKSGPSASKTPTNSLAAFNSQGNQVYVQPGTYNPGISLTKPMISPPQVVTKVGGDPNLQSQWAGQTGTAMGLLNDYQTQYQSMLAAQRAALEQNYQANVGAINQGYQQVKQETQDTQGRNMGSLKALLGRSGALTTSSGAMAEQAVGQSNINVLNKLTGARDQALSEALAAKQTGDANLYEKALSNMLGIQKEMNSYRQWELDRQEEQRRYQENNKLKQAEMLNDLTLKGYSVLKGPSELKGLSENNILRLQDGTILKRPPEKLSGGGSGSKTVDPISGLPKGFTSFVDSQIKNGLMKGEDWGTVWNRVKQAYPSVPNAQIDVALGGSASVAQGPMEASGDLPRTLKGWAQPGAYAEWKASQYKPDNSQSKWELNSEINKKISEDAEYWNTLSRDQQIAAIQSYGGDPADFGYQIAK